MEFEELLSRTWASTLFDELFINGTTHEFDESFPGLGKYFMSPLTGTRHEFDELLSGAQNILMNISFLGRGELEDLSSFF
jgi:hypothetical protein